MGSPHHPKEEHAHPLTGHHDNRSKGLSCFSHLPCLNAGICLPIMMPAKGEVWTKRIVPLIEMCVSLLTCDFITLV